MNFTIHRTLFSLFTISSVFITAISTFLDKANETILSSGLGEGTGQLCIAAVITRPIESPFYISTSIVCFLHSSAPHSICLAQLPQPSHCQEHSWAGWWWQRCGAGAVPQVLLSWVASLRCCCSLAATTSSSSLSTRSLARTTCGQGKRACWHSCHQDRKVKLQ